MPVALLLTPLPAFGAPTMPGSNGKLAFEQQPVSAETLADIYGGLRLDVGATRKLADAEATPFLQFTSRSASIAMDNWWAQTGAALINNNLLAR